MARLTTMMIPKWMADRPSSSATGSRMGESTIIAGVVSMKQPTNSSSRLMSSRIMMGLSEMLIRVLLTRAGICSRVRMRVNAVAQPMMTMVVPLVEQALAMVVNRFFRLISR